MSWSHSDQQNAEYYLDRLTSQLWYFDKNLSKWKPLMNLSDKDDCQNIDTTISSIIPLFESNINNDTNHSDVCNECDVLDDNHTEINQDYNEFNNDINETFNKNIIHNVNNDENFDSKSDLSFVERKNMKDFDHIQNLNIQSHDDSSIKSNRFTNRIQMPLKFQNDNQNDLSKPRDQHVIWEENTIDNKSESSHLSGRSKGSKEINPEISVNCDVPFCETNHYTSSIQLNAKSKTKINEEISALQCKFEGLSTKSNENLDNSVQEDIKNNSNHFKDIDQNIQVSRTKSHDLKTLTKFRSSPTTIDNAFNRSGNNSTTKHDDKKDLIQNESRDEFKLEPPQIDIRSLRRRSTGMNSSVYVRFATAQFRDPAVQSQISDLLHEPRNRRNSINEN